jgi:hypothetical protein
MKCLLFLLFPILTFGQTTTVNSISTTDNVCYRIDTVYVSAKITQLKTKDILFGIKQIAEEAISESHCLSKIGTGIAIEVFYFGIPKTSLRIAGIEKSNQTTQIGIRFILPNQKYEGRGESETEVTAVMLELTDGIPFAKMTVSSAIKKAVLECVSKIP